MINKFFTALASTSKEPTLIEELWEYFSSKYLTPNYGVYENINVSEDALVNTAMVILAGFIAVMVGASVMIFTKRVLGRLVRRLIKNEATSRESAKTLEELKLDKSLAISLFINQTTLSKAVRCREEDEFYGVDDSEGEDKKDAYKIAAVTPAKLRYKRDPQKDHFYIPEEKKHHLSVRFTKKGTNPLSLLILAVIYIVLALVIVKLLPSLVSIADGAMGSFKGNG